MAKRILISMLFVVALMPMAHSGEGKRLQFYHVTFDSRISSAAMRVRADDRLDAISKIGLTAWTEKEWEACGVCKDVKVIDWMASFITEHGGTYLEPVPFTKAPKFEVKPKTKEKD